MKNKVKEELSMTIVKRILSGLVMFIFGLEVGGFGMWYMTMRALKDPVPTSERKTSRFESYSDYCDGRR